LRIALEAIHDFGRLLAAVTDRVVFALYRNGRCLRGFAGCFLR
jgi:hypothetical protein